MANVALHMFTDAVTRTVFTQVGRLVRAGGLFVFHVNSLQDRPLRARNLPAVELEPDFVAEESGQTVRFFSEAYLRELLAGWQQVQLEPVLVPHRTTGDPFKLGSWGHRSPRLALLPVTPLPRGRVIRRRRPGQEHRRPAGRSSAA